MIKRAQIETKVDDPYHLSEAAQVVALGMQRGALAPIWVACFASAIEFPMAALILWFAQFASVPTNEFSAKSAEYIAIVGAGLFVATMALTNSFRISVISSALNFTARTAICLLIPVLIACDFQSDARLGSLLYNVILALLIYVLPTRLIAAYVMKWVAEAGLVSRHAVIAGNSAETTSLIRGLAQRKTNIIRPYGIFDDDDTSPDQNLGIPKIGTFKDLISFVRIAKVDMIIIALPLREEARINWLLEELKVLPVEVRLSAYTQDYNFSGAHRDRLLSALRQSFAPRRRLTKRIFDLFFASTALLILWPVLLIAAIAVRLETPGPVIFRQLRHGYNDGVIEVFKFRSMYAEMSDPQGRDVVTRGDPRVTRVGRFLRRTSIDELPQLFNVLRGNLSLVGPRPHALNAQSSKHEPFSQLVQGYSARHRLPPGITGWAQINGWRGEIDQASKLTARLDHDLFYIENWSVWLDLKILLLTPVSLVTTKSAY
ncbi:hypothetical protein P775_24940 [Puniceibacterium antarcticum]|uniref:Bacterial sugar transferase domain-containing protein n=1 Tax=Puniceibacterium antarcticum TaxID=1206336 RepID=A0A2G8R6I8_9RHOB|nr:exopolysaccharide biosynthesis polyprenyl glycosylphosphotransferase [Puniceibacterium antarcticum]PIL17175.1 hypothetical protein P775_24940 [Puniceibacterium antarcticum]